MQTRSPSVPAATDDAFGNPRVATAADADLVTRVLVEAFRDDAMWGAWAFPKAGDRSAKRQAVFSALVDGALRYPTTWIAPGNAAVAMWIPPGGTDLSDQQEARLETMLRDLLGIEHADRVVASLDALVAMGPTEPHYYLSLFGTDPLHAGHGYGQALLSHNLAHIDDEGAASYLDCADDLVPLYQRYGFQIIGSILLSDGPRSNGMWRPARTVTG